MMGGPTYANDEEAERKDLGEELHCGCVLCL